MKRRKSTIDLVIMGAKTPTIVRLVDEINAVKPTYRLIGFVDNNPALVSTEFMGREVFGPPERLTAKRFSKCRIINAVSSTSADRISTTRQLVATGLKFVSLVHPTVSLGYVELGEGNLIHEGAIIHPLTRIGNHCHISVRFAVGSSAIVGDYCFLGPGSMVGGYTKLGAGVFVGMQATILPRLTVGSGCVVGAGSVVIQSLADGTTVVGNPARPVRPKPTR